MTAKRPIRTRVWASGEKAESRDVGENLRDVAAVIATLPSLRQFDIENQFYTTQGLVFPCASRPLGVVNIYSEAVDGTVLTSPLSGLAFSNGVCTVKFSALVVGTRYSIIRLLVVS